VSAGIGRDYDLGSAMPDDVTEVSEATGEAVAVGLANRAVARDALDNATQETASAIVQSGPLAIRALKRLLGSGPHIAVEDAFALSDALRRPLNSTADYAEGLRAFAERRAPQFQAE
jgi:crotonobetainyl-CoA hydratase